MQRIFILSMMLSSLLFSFDASSQNSVVYQECKKISNTPSIVGTFGSKSMGGSTGTYTSLIILSLQDVNLENKKVPYQEVSIYQICNRFLPKAKTIKKYDYILALNQVVKEANDAGYLIVFTTLKELSQMSK